METRENNFYTDQIVQAIVQLKGPPFIAKNYMNNFKL